MSVFRPPSIRPGTAAHRHEMDGKGWVITIFTPLNVNKKNSEMQKVRKKTTPRVSLTITFHSKKALNYCMAQEAPLPWLRTDYAMTVLDGK